MREFSWLAVLLGILIGALLAAANAFVGLKVGMTISASIPAAVLSLLVLRTLLKRGTLLESNMVQTIGSAGESLAAGMIFTIPALFIMGEDPAWLEMVIWGGIGGLLGVCFMIPLRYVLIVKEHGVLPYPEGVACAEVLESGQRGGTAAKSVIWGAVVGGVYYLLSGLGFFRETGTVSLKHFHTEAQLDSSPALLGVGYILGPRIAAYMLSGAMLSWFIMIPAIGFFGAGVQLPVFPETVTPIAQMTPNGIWEAYIRYLGAGAVAIGGLIALVKAIPTIVSSLWHMMTGVFRFGRTKRDRTERDFPFPLVVLIVAGLGYAMWHFDTVRLDHIGVVAVIVFTFFFVTVSSRLVGLVGGSSNPVSGMTIATLLATALVYRFFVMDESVSVEASEASMTAMRVTCLSVGAIVCAAISVAGDTSQDLKTGYLVGATPYKQQVGEMIGVITSVLALAGVILLLNNTYGFGDPTPEQPHPLPAYQANIMKIIVEGVLGGQVPWTLLMMGGAAALIVEMLGLPALPFAVGMYLPLGLSTPIMVGGVVRWLIARKRKGKMEHDPGTLTAAGLVAGKGLMGVALAGVTALVAWWWSNPHWLNPFADGGPLEESVSPAVFVPWIWSSFGGAAVTDVPNIAYWWLSEAWWNALPVIPFAALVLWLWWCAGRRPPVVPPEPAAALGEPDEPIAGSDADEPSDATEPVESTKPADAIEPTDADSPPATVDDQPKPPPATGFDESSEDRIFPPETRSTPWPKYRASQVPPDEPDVDAGSGSESESEPESAADLAPRTPSAWEPPVPQERDEPTDDADSDAPTESHTETSGKSEAAPPPPGALDDLLAFDFDSVTETPSDEDETESTSDEHDRGSDRADPGDDPSPPRTDNTPPA